MGVVVLAQVDPTAFGVVIETMGQLGVLVLIVVLLLKAWAEHKAADKVDIPKLLSRQADALAKLATAQAAQADAMERIVRRLEQLNDKVLAPEVLRQLLKGP